MQKKRIFIYLTEEIKTLYLPSAFLNTNNPDNPNYSEFNFADFNALEDFLINLPPSKSLKTITLLLDPLYQIYTIHETSNSNVNLETTLSCGSNEFFIPPHDNAALFISSTHKRLSRINRLNRSKKIVNKIIYCPDLKNLIQSNKLSRHNFIFEAAYCLDDSLLNLYFKINKIKAKLQVFKIKHFTHTVIALVKNNKIVFKQPAYPEINLANFLTSLNSNFDAKHTLREIELDESLKENLFEKLVSKQKFLIKQVLKNSDIIHPTAYSYYSNKIKNINCILGFGFLLLISSVSYQAINSYFESTNYDLQQAKITAVASFAKNEIINFFKTNAKQIDKTYQLKSLLELSNFLTQNPQILLTQLEISSNFLSISLSQPLTSNFKEMTNILETKIKKNLKLSLVNFEFQKDTAQKLIIYKLKFATL